MMLQNSKWRKIVEYLTNIINDDEYFKFLNEIKNDIITTRRKVLTQEEELEEVKYFKIEELQDLDNEGFEWLDNLKKVIGKV